MIHHLRLTHRRGYHLCLVRTQDQRVLDQNMKSVCLLPLYILILSLATQIADSPHFSKLCGHTKKHHT